MSLSLTYIVLTQINTKHSPFFKFHPPVPTPSKTQHSQGSCECSSKMWGGERRASPYKKGQQLQKDIRHACYSNVPSCPMLGASHWPSALLFSVSHPCPGMSPLPPVPFSAPESPSLTFLPKNQTSVTFISPAEQRHHLFLLNFTSFHSRHLRRLYCVLFPSKDCSFLKETWG